MTTFKISPWEATVSLPLSVRVEDFLSENLTYEIGGLSNRQIRVLVKDVGLGISFLKSTNEALEEPDFWGKLRELLARYFALQGERVYRSAENLAAIGRFDLENLTTWKPSHRWVPGQAKRGDSVQIWYENPEKGWTIRRGKVQKELGNSVQLLTPEGYRNFRHDRIKAFTKQRVGSAAEGPSRLLTVAVEPQLIGGQKLVFRAEALEFFKKT